MKLVIEIEIESTRGRPYLEVKRTIRQMVDHLEGVLCTRNINELSHASSCDQFVPWSARIVEDESC